MVLLEFIDADYDRIAVLYGLLVGIGGVLNFVLDKTVFTVRAFEPAEDDPEAEKEVDAAVPLAPLDVLDKM